MTTLVVVAVVASEVVSLEVNAGDDVVAAARLVAPPVGVSLEVNTDFVDGNAVVAAARLVAPPVGVSLELDIDFVDGDVVAAAVLLFALPVVGVGSDAKNLFVIFHFYFFSTSSLPQRTPADFPAGHELWCHPLNGQSSMRFSAPEQKTLIIQGGRSPSP